MHRLFMSFAVVGVLAGCSDPLSNVPRIDDVSARDRAASVAEAAGEGRQRGGLVGRLLDRDSDDQTNPAVNAALRDANRNVPTIDERSNRPRRGLGGLFQRTSDAGQRPRLGPDTTDVEPGTVMPFGQIARVCDFSRSDLGTLVEGSSGFQIFDTIPAATAPRPFYIMGFDDGCARTFTGAVVIPGDIETHEFVRYQSSNESIGYTTTDNAYEALKASECRVGRGLPCGARAARLNQNTYFITVYNFFGGTFSAVPTEWAQVLLHDGAVLAMSLKDG